MQNILILVVFTPIFNLIWNLIKNLIKKTVKLKILFGIHNLKKNWNLDRKIYQKGGVAKSIWPLPYWGQNKATRSTPCHHKVQRRTDWSTPCHHIVLRKDWLVHALSSHSPKKDWLVHSKSSHLFSNKNIRIYKRFCQKSYQTKTNLHKISVGRKVLIIHH